MANSLAASITKAASKQAYYTILFLADRDRINDAYLAYGYFRWVDDVLDAAGGLKPEREAFLRRQKSLVEACYRGDAPRDTNMKEAMLVELIAHDHVPTSGLQTYVRHLLRVMDFDASRRGRLISQFELNEYTRSLAVAVTEAIHYFIGHDRPAPYDETRYQAVTAAHITHMLRDTFEDVQTGYFNIPREVLEANHITPQDVQSDAYRGWVRGRVLLARRCFAAGQAHFARDPSGRRRLAGRAYAARFVWLLDTIEREGYRLRPSYPERKSLRTGLRMGWLTLGSMLNWPVVRGQHERVISGRFHKL